MVNTGPRNSKTEALLVLTLPDWPKVNLGFSDSVSEFRVEKKQYVPESTATAAFFTIDEMLADSCAADEPSRVLRAKRTAS